MAAATVARCRTAFLELARTRTGDPCASLGQRRTYNTLQTAFACLNTVPITLQAMRAHVNELKRFFELYPFLDLASNSEASGVSSLYPSKVDLFASLDALLPTSSQSPLPTAFRFHTQVAYLLNSLNDGHLTYTPTCFSKLRYFQPWRIAPLYSAGAAEPTLRIDSVQFPTSVQQTVFPFWTRALGGRSPLDFVNYTVVAVDGMNAVAAVQAFTDKLSGFSRDPDSRFNYALMSLQYYDGTFNRVPGLFNVPFFLGSDINVTRSYTLRPPDGTGGTDITVDVPWIVYNSDAFTSADDFRSRFCTKAAALGVVTGKAGGLGGVAATVGAIDDDEEDQTGDDTGVGVPGPNRGRALPPSKLYQSIPSNIPAGIPAAALGVAKAPSALSFLRGSSAARQQAAASSASGGSFDLSKPLRSDPLNAFYMLDDGQTGVWVFSTLSPNGNFADIFAGWVANVTDGMRALQDAGARKLVVDVSGNGGGYVCASRAFMQYLLNNTDINTYNFRLTPAVTALLKTDFYGINQSNLAPPPNRSPVPNPYSVLSATTSQTRGNTPGTFSDFFTVPCGSRAVLTTPFPTLPRAWQPTDIAFVSDGGCGSACAILVRNLRAQWGVRSYVYGGRRRGRTFPPTSFEGGTIASDTDLDATKLDVSGLSTAEAAALPGGFSAPVALQMPLNQCFGVRAPKTGAATERFPLEWVAERADGWVDVADPRNKGDVWGRVAGYLWGREKALVEEPATATTAGVAQAGAGVAKGAETGAVATGTATVGVAETKPVGTVSAGNGTDARSAAAGRNGMTWGLGVVVGVWGLVWAGVGLVA
ncbi:hypothetical protein HDU96_001445 [Phlyctochytrium bullatum]|nr:hypothetical protein HDU96_001445 [Phlyctochytrium bullatum]